MWAAAESIAIGYGGDAVVSSPPVCHATRFAVAVANWPTAWHPRRAGAGPAGDRDAGNRGCRPTTFLQRDPAGHFGSTRRRRNGSATSGRTGVNGSPPGALSPCASMTLPATPSANRLAALSRTTRRNAEMYLAVDGYSDTRDATTSRGPNKLSARCVAAKPSISCRH